MGKTKVDLRSILDEIREADRIAELQRAIALNKELETKVEQQEVNNDEN